MTGKWVVTNEPTEDPTPRDLTPRRPVPEDPDWVPIADISGPPGKDGQPGPPGAPGATGDTPDLQDLTILFENGLI